MDGRLLHIRPKLGFKECFQLSNKMGNGVAVNFYYINLIILIRLNYLIF